mmetsp:Transcript_6994/g.8063  ORF Transcript_6994/g.8063 Transcript_6994/m.8063 type:complete len:356 (-) Transcript_6994:240-1307(-)
MARSSDPRGSSGRKTQLKHSLSRSTAADSSTFAAVRTRIKSASRRVSQSLAQKSGETEMAEQEPHTHLNEKGSWKIRPRAIPRNQKWHPEKKTIVNSPPPVGEIPPGMVWCATANNGAGMLVYSPPRAEDIPKGMYWSRRANGGLGMLVNRPPPPGSIKPNMVWSVTAFDGKGGLIYRKPHHTEILSGQMWDPTARKGKGGIVNVKPEVTPAGQIWSKVANRGKGGFVNIKPDKIPAGKFWDPTADGGKGAVVDKKILTLKRRTAIAEMVLAERDEMEERERERGKLDESVDDESSVISEFDDASFSSFTSESMIQEKRSIAEEFEDFDVSSPPPKFGRSTSLESSLSTSTEWNI